jgi:hypothetical protein
VRKEDLISGLFFFDLPSEPVGLYPDGDPDGDPMRWEARSCAARPIGPQRRVGEIRALAGLLGPFPEAVCRQGRDGAKTRPVMVLQTRPAHRGSRRGESRK